MLEKHLNDSKINSIEDLKAGSVSLENNELVRLTELTIAGALLLGYSHAEKQPVKQTAGKGVIQNTDHNFADETTSLIKRPTTALIKRPQSSLSKIDKPKYKIVTDVNLAPIPFEEAIEFLQARVPMKKNEWLDLEPKLRFRAFTVANLAEIDHIEITKRHLLKALENGESFVETWNGIKDKFVKDGKKILPGYFETVYRTNIQTAYSAGRLIQYKNHEPPAWELLFIEDERTSDTCKSLLSRIGNGNALPSTHSFWKTVGFPPYHFNCRTSFRAVYNYELNEGNIKLIENENIRFKPDTGFGGNPLEKESFWKLTPEMIKRAKKYGIIKDIEKLAHNLGLKNFDIRLASSTIELRQLNGSSFKANIIKGSEAKPHEIEIAKILNENGHEVLFTPENKLIKNIKNPEGILINENRIIEMKNLTSNNIKKIGKRIKAAGKQNAEISVINLDGKKPYSKADAINEAATALRKDRNELKEVWLIYDGKLSKIKKTRNL